MATTKGVNKCIYDRTHATQLGIPVDHHATVERVFQKFKHHKRTALFNGAHE